jgi:hypothetical protein
LAQEGGSDYFEHYSRMYGCDSFGYSGTGDEGACRMMLLTHALI